MKLSTQLLSTSLTLNEVLEIEGTLTLDPSKNIVILTSKNIILTGKLISKPQPDVQHRIVFTGIDESKFVGGGEAVLATDTGLWVMNGQLDLEGAIKHEWKQFGTDYPALEKFAAGIGSNLIIEGSATGQAHMFIKSNKPQSIRYTMLRYMGPRKNTGGDAAKELVLGRYACHFHHSENGSRGSIIEGCIARDCNSHVFVPHGSHGIAFRNNITYNTTETPFWYDLGHRTNDLVWQDNLVVKVGYVPRSQDIDSGGAPTFGAGGFNLGFGDGNKCNGNVVIGTSGTTRQSAGYIWPEIRDDNDNTKQLESSWEFENNTAINCPIGISVWHNNNHHHIVRNTTIINCPVAIFHGAYQNHYRYVGGKIVGGIIELRAASGTTNRIRFEDMEIDAAGGDYCVVADEGPLNGAAPILFLKCIMKNWKKAAILDKNPGAGLKSIDVVECNVFPPAVIVTATKAGETVRLQNGSKAWHVTKGGSKEIPVFAPTVWGAGTGLLAQYFTPDFKTLLLSRVEPNINLFDITHPSPHYLVPATFAARWTGKIQVQYSETYTFYCVAGGGVRLSVNGKSLIDKWSEKYPGEIKSSTIALQAGQHFDIKLEFFNADDRSGCTLEWASASLKREFIPMSQLRPGEVKPPDPPANKPPAASAGDDQELTLSTMLYGTGIDPEGGKVTYKWEQISGQPAIIVNPTNAATSLSGLRVGDNIFKLTVTDEKGAVGTDEVKVTVR